MTDKKKGKLENLLRLLPDKEYYYSNDKNIVHKIRRAFFWMKFWKKVRNFFGRN